MNPPNLNNLKTNCLPTQLSEPQWCEGGKLSLLPLRQGSPVSQKAPPRWFAYFMGKDLKSQFLLMLLVALLSMGGYYLVSRFVATTVVVQGRSMAPTLQDGDHFILNRWSYLCRAPQRGDLVVVKDPGHADFAVKRIVGLPCESLHFKGGKVMVNGKHLLEPYLPPRTQTFCPDTWEKFLVVGKDHYFVLGDNRANSEDSRFYGAVHRSQIIGSISK